MGRRRRKSALAGGFAALVLLAGCGSTVALVDVALVDVALVDVVPADGVPPPSVAPASTGLPEGWRWESFREAEIAVPGTWGNSNSIDGPCIAEIARDGSRHELPPPRPPVVGRPGHSGVVGCGSKDSAMFSAEKAGSFLAFGTVFPRRLPPAKGDRVTIAVGAVEITVQAPAALRKQILATARTIEADANGCPVGDPVSREPGVDPEPRLDVRTLTGVRSVTACRYDVQRPFRPIEPGVPTLWSSLRLQGRAAAKAVDALAAAPPAGGQDRKSCSAGAEFGDEMIVLRVDSDQGSSRLQVRFSGCGHNGVADGFEVRKLTRASLKPFVVGPNKISGFSGGSASKREALWPDYRGL